MSLRADHYLRGQIVGIRYEIEREGFGLPFHIHSTRDTYHNVIPLRGRVIVLGNDWVRVLEQGEIFDGFDCGQLHAITAQGPAAWLNLYPNGAPQEWEGMAEDQKHTLTNSRIDIPDWALAKLKEL